MTQTPHILVTGGAGYIGSHVVLALLAKQYRVTVLDNLSTGDRRLIPQGVKLVEGNVSDATVLDACFSQHNFDAVMHFAASVVLPESVSQPLAYYQNNVANTIALLQAMVRHDVKKIIFSSTGSLYAPNDGKPLTELSPLGPQSPYSATKMMSERIITDAAAAHNLRTVILRYFNVAGADPQGRTGQVGKQVTHLLRLASQTALGQRAYLSIFGDDYPTRDGTAIRDYIHVTDLAHAHVLALDYLLQGGSSEIFNCGYGRGYTVREVVAAFDAVLGRPLPTQKAPARPGDTAAIVADSDKIRRVLGWQPQHDDLAFIVRTAMAWEEIWAKQA